MRKIVILFAVASSLLSFPAFAAEAGKFLFVNGDVRIERGGKVYGAQRGVLVEDGDTLTTADGATAQLRMVDGAMLSLRPETRMSIDAYHWGGKADGKEKSFFGLLKGGFRALTGLIGRFNKSAYQVKTPTATIGIRGTDHEPFHIPEPAPGETPPGPPGTYDKVNSGATFLQSAGGRLEIAPGQVGFVGFQPGAIPQRLPLVPTFLQAEPRRGGADRPAGAPSPQDEAAVHSLRRTAGAGSLLPPPPGGDGTLVNPQFMPPPQLPPPPQPGTFDPRYPGQTAVPAANGYVGVGGDLSPGQLVGSGGGVVGLNMGVMLDGGGQLVSVSSNDGFRYERSGAPLASSGSVTFSGQTVNWGVYAGGVINDNMGVRSSQYFHFMGGGTATPLVTVKAGLSTPLFLTTIIGQTQLISETGLVSGSVGSLSIKLENVSGVPNVMEYNLGVTDSTHSRSWSAVLQSSTATLADFLSQGANLVANCTGSGCAATPGSGNATGAVIGGSTISGVLTSFDLHDGTAAVTGSVAVKP